MKTSDHYSRLAFRLTTWVAILAASCLEPYPPPPGANDLRLLVVDGFLNSTSGLAQVKLSRSLPIQATNGYPQEVGAVVEVEDEHGGTFILPETSPGLYNTTNNSLSVGERYRVKIGTADGHSYESDLVELRQSPVMEDVFWVHEGDGITIKVDSRDPTGTTRYYQWFYTETWEYDADEPSFYIVRSGRPVPRTAEERINICYSTEQSSKILVSTTADQTGDVINDYALVHIARGSKKVSRTYSILVQQRALDEDAYKYWSQLERSTENLGSLFDPIPTEVTGNIRALQPGETTLGYFSGSAVEEKRIFIRFSELPKELKYVSRRQCTVDSIGPVLNYPEGSPMLTEFTIAFPFDRSEPSFICMDCRLEGGTVTKPPFWPL